MADLSPEDTEAVLAYLKAGRVASTGNWKEAASWRWSNIGFLEEWGGADIQPGSKQLTEAEMRAQIRSASGLFAGFLDECRHKDAQAEAGLAWLRADMPALHRQLRYLTDTWGDQFGWYPLILAGTGGGTGGQSIEALNARANSFDTWHVLMRLIDYDKSPVAARTGLAFVAELERVLGTLSDRAPILKLYTDMLAETPAPAQPGAPAE